MGCHSVGVRPSLKVVVLEQFLILQVSVLGLNRVQLVTEGQVILISLLNLEDLCLQLGNEKVFLVGSEMNAVVILHNNQYITVRNQHQSKEEKKETIKWEIYQPISRDKSERVWSIA